MDQVNLLPLQFSLTLACQMQQNHEQSTLLEGATKVPRLSQRTLWRNTVHLFNHSAKNIYLSVFNVLKSTRRTPLGIFKDFIASAAREK